MITFFKASALTLLIVWFVMFVGLGAGFFVHFFLFFALVFACLWMIFSRKPA
ncbi:MAG TPA: hypothetical protein VFO76_07180 [Candidatus Kapabacteria bacterium]|nr:hypothetical protein [Candidatus Kapabacteria bacterium]